MSKPKNKLPPFTPAYNRSRQSKAWLVLDPWSRWVYVELVSMYRPQLNNNGSLYLSSRKAAKKLGCTKERAAEAFKKLAFYGFIVMTKPGYLGVEGEGKSPHWRATELPYEDKPPSYDFENWDGELYVMQKPPSHYKRRKNNLSLFIKSELVIKPSPA